MEYTQKLTWSQLKKYQFVMDGDLSSDYFSAYLLGQKSFNVGLGLIKQWESALEIEKKKKKQLSDTARNNNKGIAYEKEGKIKSAIKIYEKNIEIGYPATHSYTRLMVIYHKERKFEDEIRIIEQAIDMFSDDIRYDKNIQKWKERLNKLMSK